MTQSFVFGYQLDGSGSGIRIDDPATAPDSDVWLHFDYSQADIEDRLSALGLPAWVVESLIRPNTRPRTVLLPQGVLMLLRGVNLNPGADPEDMVSLRFWFDQHRLVTVRQRRLFAVQDVSAELQAGRGPKTTAEALVSIVERLADRIAECVDTIEEQITHYETSVETDPPQGLRAEVAATRRQTAVVRRFLAPQRDALDTLYLHSKGLLSQEHAYAIREQTDRIARYVEDLDLVRERTLVIQEELINRIAQEQNARMYVLSIIAAIFLPITFITGLFGMNVAGLPGIDHPQAFLLVAGCMTMVTIGTLIYLRSKGWF